MRLLRLYKTEPRFMFKRICNKLIAGEFLIWNLPCKGVILLDWY